MDTAARTIYGVDFSGAKDAGRKIWIAEGQVSDDGLIISKCWPISEWFHCGRKLDACLEALGDFIAQERAVFGLDFPFGLPQELMGEVDWENFVRSFNERYPSPKEFKAGCFQAAGFQERKRQTDYENHAPFSPYNLRLYRQTYYGINHVLRPLVDGDLASVLPMQEPHPDRSWVLEVCPASTLRKQGVPQLYKGGRPEHRENREQIAYWLTGRGLQWPDDLIDRVIADREGDGLDSVIAAVVTAAAVAGGEAFDQKNELYRLEGYIYV